MPPRIKIQAFGEVKLAIFFAERFVGFLQWQRFCVFFHTVNDGVNEITNFTEKTNIFSVKSTVLLKSWFHGKFLGVIAFYSTLICQKNITWYGMAVNFLFSLCENLQTLLTPFSQRLFEINLPTDMVNNFQTSSNLTWPCPCILKYIMIQLIHKQWKKVFKWINCCLKTTHHFSFILKAKNLIWRNFR